jgi:amino acid permease
MKAQGIDRKSYLPYCSPLEPYGAWISLVAATFVLGISGYGYLKPGGWATDGFIFA